ncbi:MAG: hypothetical protein HEQ10_17290 [Dolichospermum sp. DEX182a]|nr:hypothetical protein [Dolichospermum sp. DEX182a]QSV63327.1 MAG: hypothetical protein HEQ26_11815 [Dolichospermum sp. DL01]
MMRIFSNIVEDFVSRKDAKKQRRKEEEGFYKLKQEFIEAAKDELSELKKLSN